MLLCFRKQFWENCRKKTARCGMVYAPSSETIQKQKNWQKKVIPIDAPMDIQIAILITLTKFLADSPRKLRSIPNFFLLSSYPKNLFIALVFGTRFDNLLRFCPKWTRFFPPSVKTNIQSKNFLRIFFPASYSCGGFECCILTHPDQRFCRKDGKMSLKCQFFFSFVVQKKSL